MKKIAVLFSGAGSNLAHLIATIHHREAVIVAAITDNPDAGGIHIAQAADIPCEVIDPKAFNTREDFDTQLVKQLAPYVPDLVVMAGFMRIVTPIFTHSVRAINLHPSLLPRHKGLRAIERSYEDGYDHGGVSVHWVSDELDGGEVILQRKVFKADRDLTAYDAAVRAMEKEALIEAIRTVLKKL